MSIAICRVEKVKGASGVTGLQIHNRRERANSNSNPDIDHSRSSLNYALIETPDKSFNALADERIKQAYTGTQAIRKDAVRVVTSIFTSDYSFFENKPIEEQRKFFDDCLKWTQERFGAENIISAIVHMDEETPHLHIEFVPLTTDGRLTAKSVLGGRVDLQKMQDDFYKSVGEVWGMERGERADLDDPNDKPRKHKSTAQLKSETEKELAALEVERDKLAAENAEIKKANKALRDEEAALKSNVEGLRADIKQEQKNFSEMQTKFKPRKDDLERVNKLAKEVKPPVLSNRVNLLKTDWDFIINIAKQHARIGDATLAGLESQNEIIEELQNCQRLYLALSTELAAITNYGDREKLKHAVQDVLKGIENWQVVSWTFDDMLNRKPSSLEELLRIRESKINKKYSFAEKNKNYNQVSIAPKKKKRSHERD
jgi:hypothetical protein